MNKKRIRKLNDRKGQEGQVIYWMDRDQRLHDNWAFICAVERAKRFDAPVMIVFNLVKDFLGGTARQYDFKVEGLKRLEKSCKDKNIPFVVLQTDDSAKELISFLAFQKPSLVVTDFSPLRIQRRWKEEVAKAMDVPVLEVDAHNIVPAWVASEKKEFAARTFRPKVHRQLREFLEDYPNVMTQKKKWPNKLPKNDWKKIEQVGVDRSVSPVEFTPGEEAAKRMVRSFIEQRLRGYAETRNDPTLDGQSNLSPYLHYGHVSSQYVALAVKSARAPKQDKDAFLEELIVRKELSDNFCLYEPNYDSFKGFHEWAQESLNKHRNDKRKYVYSRDEFEEAKTHDPLWNAAQLQMVKTGKMHGYMRMYWAKKILEWTNTPEYAQKVAIYLNDKYEIDGRDPNGYTGIAWSIGGVHDRAWFERDVYGKVRYMNANGASTKFDTKKYITTWISEQD